jgi:hypothetical protein
MVRMTRRERFMAQSPAIEKTNVIIISQSETAEQAKANCFTAFCDVG